MVLQARADGYCQAEGQLEIGILSIAVPVRDREGSLIAAINMGVPASRHSLKSLRTSCLPMLREAASEIEFALAHRL